MPSPSGHPLYSATERLIAALDRLENNLEQVTVNQGRDTKQHEQITLFERENRALKQEHDKLNTTIAQLQDQYGNLHQTASTIYSKLEDSIKRLTKIIES